MKTVALLAVIFTLLIDQVNFKKQGNPLNSDGELRTEISRLNSRIEAYYLNENIDSLIGLYTKELTFFPEYKPAIFEAKKLGIFYDDWFKQVENKKFKKNIYQIEAYDDYVLEIGTYDLQYRTALNSAKEYNGKYMIMWKRNNEGKLKIISETFGAFKYIETEDVPYFNVKVEESNFVTKHTVSKNLQEENEEFNAIVLKAVAEGHGDTRANGFTQDAILLAAFDTILVGMDAIRPKMLKTYSPASSYIVKHSYVRMYDLGDYAFINGHYKGGWGDTINGGMFEGNMSSLMKRTKNGKLLMHRQIGNRQSKLVIFKN